MTEPLVDSEEFGRRVRAARILARCDRVADACALIEERTGLHMSERTLYAIERGEQAVSLEQFTAIAYGLRPPGGNVFFTPTLRSDVLDYYATQDEVADWSVAARSEVARRERKD